MRELRREGAWVHHGTLAAVLLLLVVSCFDLALSSPTGSWPNFSKRNVQALARDGLLRPSNGATYDLKRSISTLAKNGQLPTFRAPEDNPDVEETDPDVEKRNLAAIARLKSFIPKRNIGSMVRNGFRAGKRGYDDYKRNIGSLARNGYLKTDQDNSYQKRDSSSEGEYYFPFYQNQLPPLAEVDSPLDYNELYDLEQSNNPELLPPLSELYEKKNVAALLRQDAYNTMRNSPHYRPFPTPGGDDGFDQIDKRSIIGLPNHGLYRTVIRPTMRSKRYLVSIPELVYSEGNWPEDDSFYENQEKRSVDTDNLARSNVEKRHIGALARLGWLPSFRYSGTRYSRSGRARFFVPTFSDNYRKHSYDEDSGAGEYIADTEGASKAGPDYADVPPPPVPADAHPPGRGGGRAVSGDLPPSRSPHSLNFRRYIDAINRNRWEPEPPPHFYNFRSLKVPRNYNRAASASKRYLLLPAVDNFMLRKSYPNNSLPSRRKNQ